MVWALKLATVDNGLGPFCEHLTIVRLDSDCGVVGIAVTSEARDQQFESNHWQILFTVNIIEKARNKKKLAQFL